MRPNKTGREVRPVVNSTAARAAAAILSAALICSAAGVALNAAAKKGTDTDAVIDAAEESVVTAVTTTAVPEVSESGETFSAAYELRKAGVQEYNTANVAHTTTTAPEPEAEETAEEETAEEEVSAPAAVADMDETVLYAAQSVNFRTQPDLDAPIIYILDEGDSVTADGITADDKWYSVSDSDGVSGFVLAELVTDKAPESAEPVTEASQTDEAPAGEVTVGEYNTGVINYTYTEFRMMCYVVHSEVGYCSEENKLAVANVIINRVKSDLFPDNIAEVLTAPNQFTAIHNYYDQTFPPSDDTIAAVKKALDGEGADLVNGATFYYAPQFITPEKAAWFENQLQFAAVVDGQRYFKNKEQ